MRIYFDKQIFSHLFKQEQDKYCFLLPKLYRAASNNLFCYSHAHLLDLKNDTTNIKFAELEFMETLVADNYISYHGIEKKTSFYLAKPLETFASEINTVENIDITSLLSKDSEDLSELEKMRRDGIKNAMSNIKSNYGLLNPLELPYSSFKPEDACFLEDLPIDKLSGYFKELLDKMEDNKSIYKQIRNTSDKYINNGKYTAEADNSNFNLDLKDSLLGKTFLDFVEKNLNPDGDKYVSRQDFYVNAYCILDLLGICKEPAKSVKFNNMLNDGFHSYYSAYTDMVVSDDKGFLKKTKILYRLLGIETKVCHIDEFIETFDFYIDNENHDFSELLRYDLENGIVLGSKKSLQFNRETITIKTALDYFGLFNRVDNMTEDKVQYYYMYSERKNYSPGLFFREFEMVINHSYDLFGSDVNSRGKFDWENEKAQISNLEWPGRLWKLNGLILQIEVNKGNDKLGMLITLGI
ncbi:hypothetical protein SAMN05444372_11072 [Flavobacterium micromati]|uniref:Uncharacterized protein n=1 Tax=Flavobacterium micromati TaxID=229205 RepID=A0A1M5MX46_9FLAO|nr:hypothetical protein [Flavobacterium micromati]SHG81785.1 hypothetical protein SAMN05444372_11072 [Flavobacterium micromati]